MAGRSLPPDFSGVEKVCDQKLKIFPRPQPIRYHPHNRPAAAAVR
jgi:hypothetical protein